MQQDRGFKVRGLGEIALRCNDLGKMVRFYEDIIGLERLPGNTNTDITFFRIADGFGGHTAVLALFDKMVGAEPDPATGDTVVPKTGAEASLHHIALSLPFEEQKAAMRWYEAQGVPYRVELFGWVGWRGVFVEDPEGNTVELVAYDKSIDDN